MVKGAEEGALLGVLVVEEVGVDGIGGRRGGDKASRCSFEVWLTHHVI